MSMSEIVEELKARKVPAGRRTKENLSQRFKVGFWRVKKNVTCIKGSTDDYYQCWILITEEK
jgi:hypothetical protein